MGTIQQGFEKSNLLSLVIGTALDDIDEDDFEKIEDMGVNEVREIVSNIRIESEDDWTPPQPASDSRIWRYINLTQLLSILEKESLWFTDISNFEDPYEGTVPKGNVQDEIQEMSSRLEVSDETAKVLHSFYTDDPGIGGYYVNCWNLSPHESAALWEQYIDTSQGVAISTTVDNLKSAIGTDEIMYGEVNYIDYEEESIPQGILPLLFHKRRSFKHENEFRICIGDSEADLGDGNYVDVEVGELIDQLYLSPISPNWFEDLITDILETYKIDCELQKSDLYSDPVY